MKKLFVVLIVFGYYSVCNIFAWDEDHLCKEPEQCFLDVIEYYGLEEGIIWTMGVDGFDFVLVFLKYREKTEPVIRKIINNSQNYNSRTVGHACWKAYHMKLNDLSDDIQKFAHQKESQRLQFTATLVYAKMCNPDKLLDLLTLTLSSDLDKNRGVIAIIRERKVFDSSLLEQWRDDQLEKDKKRDKKIMREWFVKEINETIKVLKEEQDKKSAQNRKETKTPKVNSK